jgi:4-hydroxy-tetrahydrodipicolinate reductase
MGTVVCRAVLGDPSLEIAAAIDPAAEGRSLSDLLGASGSDVICSASLDALLDASVEVVVDFTTATSATASLGFCADAGIHVVCGTTGFSPEDIESIVAAFSNPDSPNCVIASNFAISAVLMVHFGEIAARYLEGVEIIELHHNEKRDAPSGTALETALRIASSRKDAGVGDFARDATTNTVLEGARGGIGPGGIHVHAVRLPGFIAHQEVIFSAVGQALSIRQDSFDRTSFMPGVLLAIKKVIDTPGLTFGLEALLGL